MSCSFENNQHSGTQFVIGAPGHYQVVNNNVISTFKACYDLIVFFYEIFVF